MKYRVMIYVVQASAEVVVEAPGHAQALEVALRTPRIDFQDPSPEAVVLHSTPSGLDIDQAAPLGRLAVGFVHREEPVVRGVKV